MGCVFYALGASERESLDGPNLARTYRDMVSLEPRIGLDRSYCAQTGAGYVDASKYQTEPTDPTRTSFCRVGAYSGRLSHHCRRLVNRENRDTTSSTVQLRTTP